MPITVETIMARVKDRKESVISGLASQEGNELYRCQGDYRTLEWILGLPEQLQAEEELDKEMHSHVEDD